MQPRASHPILVLAAAAAALALAGCGGSEPGRRGQITWDLITTPLAGEVQAAPATVASGDGRRVAASWDANPFARGTGAGSQGTALIGDGGVERVITGARAPLHGPFALRDGRVAQLTGRYNERAGVTNDLHLQVLDAAGKVVRDAPIGAPAAQIIATDVVVRSDGRLLIAVMAARLRSDGTAPGARGPAWRTTTSVIAGTVDAITQPRTIDTAEVTELEDPQLAVYTDGTRSLVVIADAVPDGQRIRAGVGGLAGPNRLIEVATGQDRVGSVDGTLIGRRAVVAWGAQEHGEEPHGPWSIRAATSPDGAAFGAPQMVDPGRVEWFPPSYRIVLVALPGGGALLAWSQAGSTPDDAEDRSLLMAAAAGSDGRFRQPQRVGRGALGGLAIDAAGRAALSTQQVGAPAQTGRQRTTVQVALRGAGSAARFGSLQAVATTTAADYGADPPAPCFSRSGELLLGWTTSELPGDRSGLLLARGQVNW